MVFTFRHRIGVWIVGLFVCACLSLPGNSAAATTVEPESAGGGGNQLGQAVLGACGVFSPPHKVIRRYRTYPGDPVKLKCGPWFTSTPRWGFRHIMWRHQRDFELQATGTSQNWRDVLDLAIEMNAIAPERVILQSNRRTCRSRNLNLYDLRSGHLVRRKIFRVIISPSGNVITAFPSRSHCRPR